MKVLKSTSKSENRGIEIIRTRSLSRFSDNSPRLYKLVAFINGNKEEILISDIIEI